MKLKFHILFLLASVISLTDLFSQDTIRYGASSHYNDVDHHRGKGFIGSVDYKREDIVFSENKIRVEYCYYYHYLEEKEIERNCRGATYELLNDSLLLVDGFKWNYYQKAEDHYLVWKEDSLMTEYGQATSLIPLKREGVFYTISNLRKDTLWQEDYARYKIKDSYSMPQFCYYPSKIKGRIYEYDEVQIPPTYKDGTSFDTIKIVRKDFCYGEPMGIDISLMMCIITKEGKIVNIEQAIGNLDTGCHRATIKKVILQIASWDQVKPARIRGVPVNVRWFIPIYNLDRKYVHPAFADTPKNRKWVLERKEEGILNDCP